LPVEDFTYSYNIQKIEFGIPTPIANFLSNAVPPQIGSILDVGAFSKEGYKEYLVVKVISIPEPANEKCEFANRTYVKVFVEKIK
jgi:hypothetical protein